MLIAEPNERSSVSGTHTRKGKALSGFTMTITRIHACTHTQSKILKIDKYKLETGKRTFIGAGIARVGEALEQGIS